MLLNQQIEKALVEAQVSNLEAQVAHLRQNMGELDVKLGDIKANYLRQTLAELQDTSQRLRGIETALGPARRLRDIKAQGASSDVDEPEYSMRINRVRDGGMIAFDATNETTVEPGDVIEVKLKRREPDDLWSLPTEAAGSLIPNSSLAQGTASISR